MREHAPSRWTVFSFVNGTIIDLHKNVPSVTAVSRCLGVGKETRFTNTIESWMVCYFVSTGVGLWGFLTGSLIPSHQHPHPHPTFRLECFLFVCRTMEGFLEKKPSKFWEDRGLPLHLWSWWERRGQGKVESAPSSRLMMASVPVLTPYSNEHWALTRLPRPKACPDPSGTFTTSTYPSPKSFPCWWELGEKEGYFSHF